MLSSSSGYFGIPFKGYRGITQGNPLSPTIFNMTVDAVICYWVVMVAPTEDGTDVLGLSIQDLMVYFYADNGLVVLTHPERLQRAFDILASLFDRVGLQTNARKTVSIACQQYYVPIQMSLEAYKWQTTGTGPTFWELQRRRVACPE